MILLSLLLERQGEGAELIARLARVQNLSLTRLAAASDVQKASLLRYCKRQPGGYLSEDARDRVLKELGWQNGGLTSRRVHIWELMDVDDAEFLLATALGGKARLSLLAQHGDTRRIAVGVWGNAPMIVATEYALDGTKDDPLTSHIAGSFGSAKLDIDSRALDAARQSPKAFFKMFGSPDDSLASKGSGTIEVPTGVQELLDLGFSHSELNDMAEDFLAMRCRREASEMQARYERFFQYAHAATPSKPTPVWLKTGLERTARDRVAELAKRPLLR